MSLCIAQPKGVGRQAMEFKAQIKPPAEKGAKDPLYFMIRDQEIIVRHNQDQYWLTTETDILLLNLDLTQSHFIGSWHEHFCYALDFPEHLSLIYPLKSISLRDAFSQFSSSAVRAISLAKQVLTWNRNFLFCGQCGQPTINLPDERAKVCANCGLTNYPRLSPSIIVSVVRDERILLARSRRFPEGMYSVLAGFVEPGETLEECIHREVFEEVGVEITNIQYFGSQNWPFPHSLMIGFTADYLTGEISIDDDEIVDARWFKAMNLPRIPGGYSIARKMIDHFSNSRL